MGGATVPPRRSSLVQRKTGRRSRNEEGGTEGDPGTLAGGWSQGKRGTGRGDAVAQRRWAGLRRAIEERGFPVGGRSPWGSKRGGVT